VKTVKMSYTNSANDLIFFWGSISGKRILGMKEINVHLLNGGIGTFEVVTGKEIYKGSIIGGQLYMAGLVE